MMNQNKHLDQNNADCMIDDIKNLVATTNMENSMTPDIGTL